MTMHRIGTRQQWLAERLELLDAEKALLARGKYQEAMAQLAKVLAKAPDNPEALAAYLGARL